MIPTKPIDLRMTMSRTVTRPDLRACHHPERLLIDALFPRDAPVSGLCLAEWTCLFSHLRNDDCRSCQAYFEWRREVIAPSHFDRASERLFALIAVALPPREMAHLPAWTRQPHPKPS